MKQKLLWLGLTLLMMGITVISTILIMKTIQNNSLENSDPLSIELNINDIDESEFIKDNNSRQGDLLSYVTINGSENLFMRNGVLCSSSLLCNYNSKYFLRISLIHNDKLLYRTGLIPSNKGISNLPLEKSFENGIYDIKLIYDFYSSINSKSPTSVEVNVKLIVES